MPEHKLKEGLEIIGKLFRIGQILGYHSEKEYPIDKENESAVDVAWLFEPKQKYPLFIFEVESKTTNSISSNPLKIFGETNQKFEKPLFLFHLLLTGGQTSGRIPQLERTYGTYNYRIYRFSLDDETVLIMDILSQHRRLSNHLQIIAFLTDIIENWRGINIDAIVEHIEFLEFELYSGLILPSYAHLSKKYPVFKKHYVRRLQEKVQIPNGLFEPESYDTYLGTEYSTPIHLGILSSFNENNLEYKYFEDFKNWQEKSYYLKQIGPSFGLSRDYDLFILGMAGSVLGLTAALFYKVSGAREYIAKELLEIIKNSDRFEPTASLFNALWLLHISPDTDKGKEYFEFARSFINENGGIPELIYNDPKINYIDFFEGDENLDDYGNKINIPSWADFQKNNPLNQCEPDKIFECAINYLTENDDEWNPISKGQL
jgi:hypothetical protein